MLYLQSLNKRRLVCKNRGFTLIEVVVATCIFGIIAVSLGGVFISGTKLWQRAQTIGGVWTGILLELEGISKNMRQSLELEDIGFVGTKRDFEFPAIIGNSIFKIVYSFDKSKKKFLVKKIKYEDVLSKKIKEPKSLEVFGADDVSFEYFIYDLSTNSYSWEEKVEDEKIPAIVKLKIEKNDKVIKKAIFIPIGYGKK